MILKITIYYYQNIPTKNSIAYPIFNALHVTQINIQVFNVISHTIIQINLI
jgi:hypothetical protein